MGPKGVPEARSLAPDIMGSMPCQTAGAYKFERGTEDATELGQVRRELGPVRRELGQVLIL